MGEVLDSLMSPSVSRAPTAVASKDQPPGETSPKEESLDSHSGEGGDYRRRRVALLLGIVQDAAREASRKVTADRLRIASDRRVALLLGITQDAAGDAWRKVLADRIKIARARRLALLLDMAQDAACDAWKV